MSAIRRFPRVFGFALPLVVTLIAATVSAQPPAAPDPLDWPHWRGPEMNGISREKGLVSSWSPAGENLLWKNEEIAARSTPIVMRGKLYVTCRHMPDTTKEAEKVVCVDAATGNKIWENVFNVYLTDAPAERAGWSCVAGDIETGNVFALGLCDYFQAMDGATGKTLWSHSLSEEYGMISTYGGRTNMPVVFEDLVIISGVTTGWGEYSVPAHRFIAFDKSNGQAVWIASTRLRPLDTIYSSPVLANFNGQMAIVSGSGDGSIYAIQPRTGKEIWHYDASLRGINTTPTVAGNIVFCGHAEENIFDNTIMGAVFAVDGTGTGDVTKSKQLWLDPKIMVGRAAPLFVNDLVYILDDAATLYTLNPQTGAEISKLRLKGGRVIFGCPLYADGKIYIGEDNGMFYILEATEQGAKIVHTQRLSNENIKGSPIVSHGRLYLPTSSAMYCIGAKDQTPAADPRPTAVPETPSAADQTPAQLQIVPVESLLRPGQKQQLKARLYNANGRYLSTVEGVNYEVKGAGTIEKTTDNGKEKILFATAKERAHSASIITAKFGELTATARVRTVPVLPWSFDFQDGQVPTSWIGSAYRHIVLDDDLLGALRSQSPRAAGLYIYLMTSFINGNTPNVKFQDAGPRQAMTEFLRYFGLDGDGKPATIDDAKKEFDAGLELLKKENVLAKWEWAQGPGGIELAVARGDRAVTGNGVMCKITTIPKGTRSQGWMGHTSLYDYTIQADVRGSERNGKLPEMGVINQRYTLAIIGSTQELQIRSWTSRLDIRFAVTIPFTFKPDVWYTMKFESQNKDGKAILRGKVWPRGEAEPANWLIEGTDEAPNMTGSPGLFGNAIDAEVYFDNVKVTPNAS